METILAPIDFSPITDDVVAEAVALARAFHARLVLFHVVQPMPMAIEFVGMYGYGPDVGATEGKVRELLEERVQQLAAEGVTAESALGMGVPVSAVLEEAQAVSADYIVMGSHGHSAIYDLLIGSTTRGVLLDAQCPVVIVRPTEIKAAGKFAARAESRVLRS
jgi:nucleotide-binding universal stress UspA family protein